MTPALVALILQLAPPIILAVERAFATKDKSGPDKKAAVVHSLEQIAETMHNAQIPLPDGTLIPPQSVSDKELGNIVETEVQRLKQAGKLGETPAVGTGIFIVRGSVVSLPL